jgi:hypothetical protein
MKIYQSQLFEKKIKKMSKTEKVALDREISVIAEKPNIGEEKKVICEVLQNRAICFKILRIDMKKAEPIDSALRWYV